MEFIRYAVWIVFCLTGQAGVCTLDRNKYNPYPFMLKLIENGRVLCHGALMAPNVAVSACHPVQHIVDAHEFDGPQLLNLTITGYLYGKKSVKICSASETPNLVRKRRQGRNNRNVVVWRLANKFNVTMNNPYMFPFKADLRKRLMEAKFKDLLDFECCHIPTFKSQSPEDDQIIKHEVTYVVGALADYWTGMHCNASKDFSRCTKINKRDYFFVYSPEDFSPLWYQGAPVFCNGNAQGIVTKVMSDTFSETIIMVEKLVFDVPLLRFYARDWPTTPAYESTT